MKLRCIALFALTACSEDAPRPMLEYAELYGALYENADDTRLLALYAPGPKTEHMPAGHLEWLRAQLGRCESPQLMWTTGPQDFRYRFPCERGALEAHFTLDERGEISKLRTGAADIATPEHMHTAMIAVLASLPWEADVERPFFHNLTKPASRELGRCELVRPWVVGKNGGLFHVRCAGEKRAILRLGVRQDGTLKSAELLSGSGYKGPWRPD